MFKVSANIRKYKYHSTEDGFMRVNYKSKGFNYCIQQNGFGEWELYASGKDWEPTIALGYAPFERFELPKGQDWTDLKVKQFLLLKNKSVSF